VYPISDERFQAAKHFVLLLVAHSLSTTQT
jgi:hypothetical protein